jgi:hypothetical protein
VIRTRKRIAALTAGFVVIAGTAAAFMTAQVTFEGEGTANAGELEPVAAPATIGGWSGILPGENRPVSVSITNPTNNTVTATHIEFHVSTTAAGCNGAWFSVLPGNALAKELEEGKAPVAVAAKETQAMPPFQLHFAEVAENQDSCRKAPIAIRVVLH